MKKPDLQTITNFFEKHKLCPLVGMPSMAEDFFDFYESKGWLVGKSPMKKWEAAANRWIRQNKKTVGNGGLSCEAPFPSTY